MSIKKYMKKFVQKEGVKLLKEKGLPMIKKELEKRKGKK
ncbi:hypothetical protein ACUXCC_001584 [Cytobacillus horneckiae]